MTSAARGLWRRRHELADCWASGDREPYSLGRPPEPGTVPYQLVSGAREVITWELAQKYFLDQTFGGSGPRPAECLHHDLGFHRHFVPYRCPPPLAADLPAEVPAPNRAGAEWDIDYDVKNGRINASAAFVNYRLGNYTVGGGNAYLQAPSATLLPGSTQAQAFNQFRLLLGYGQPNKRRFSGATNLGFDVNLGFLQYSAVQLAYNGTAAA